VAAVTQVRILVTAFKSNFFVAALVITWFKSMFSKTFCHLNMNLVGYEKQMGSTGI
jgi:hypothetical protein